MSLKILCPLALEEKENDIYLPQIDPVEAMLSIFRAPFTGISRLYLALKMGIGHREFSAIWSRTSPLICSLFGYL